MDLRNKKEEWVVLAKGFAIFLVVFGHTFPQTLRTLTIPNLIWHFIYNFHMPLFFFLSGYLYFLNINKYKSMPTHYFIKKKFKLLMIPYMSFSLISYIGIYLAFNSNRLANILTKAGYNNIELRSIFFQIFTYENHIDKHLWFLYVLFLIFIIAKLSTNRINFRIWILFLISFAANLHLFYLPIVINRSLEYLFYFYLAKHISIKYLLNLRYHKYSLILIFIFLNVIKVYTDITHFNLLISTLLSLFTASLGIISIIIIISQLINDTLLKKPLDILSKYTYDIYLIHQPFLVSGIVGILFVYTYMPVLLISLVTTLIGIILPIIISKFIIRKNRILSYLLLGIDRKSA